MKCAIESDAQPVRAHARVLANRQEGNCRRLSLGVPSWPGSNPGQFVMIGAGVESAVVRRDPLLPRPMAVYRDPGPLPGAGGGEIELLYRVVGRGTALMAEALPGQSIPLVGPLGRGFPIEAHAGPALLVGGGSGIASLYELARALRNAGRDVVVLLGARTRADLIGRGDFEELDVELVCTTEDGSDGILGRVTEPLAERLADRGAETTLFAVGPTAMMRACADLAEARSVSCLVSLENPMACGFGVCLGCAVPRSGGGFSLVCRSGPVFDAREIDWEGLP
ncbi:MAG TPA: dihydroorotate dehydrogenase electron transfer subunit [Deltaproteobacteria bacterium]|nr:dihydroorotate dehydrogenase electron transfer subunit [Deltaproteobacteria bacterium]